jgi:hypothetical protein
MQALEGEDGRPIKRRDAGERRGGIRPELQCEVLTDQFYEGKGRRPFVNFSRPFDDPIRKRRETHLHNVDGISSPNGHRSLHKKKDSGVEYVAKGVRTEAGPNQKRYSKTEMSKQRLK